MESITPYQMTCIILITIAALILTWAFYAYIIYPKQYAKNKAKQEAKERAVVDKLFNEATAGSVHGSYEDFNETELGATSL